MVVFAYINEMSGIITYMFNIEALQYIIFGVLVIPPFIIGFFKGWRASLFTLAITIGMGGIIIGISFATYDALLWPLFRDLFVSKKIGSGLDPNALRELSKVSVISTTLGVMLLPVLLITWGVYLIFKKLLRKNMMPKVSDIDSNSKNIARKNLLISRITGTIINGTAGTIIAATAASSVATITTNSTHQSFFNKATNGISYLYNFGQGEYDVDYQKMYEFLKFTEDEKNVDAMENVFEMDLDKAPLSKNIEMVSRGKFHDAMTKLFGNEKSTTALINLMTSRISNRTVDLAPGATASESNKADKGITNIENIFNSKHLNFNLKRAIAVKTVNDMFQRVLSFEKSNFYKQWQTAQELVKTTYKTWKDSKDTYITKSRDKVSTEQQIDIKIQEIATVVAELGRLNDSNGSLPSSIKYWLNKKNISYPIWQTQIHPEQDAHDKYDTALANWTTKDNDLTTTNQNLAVEKRSKFDNEKNTREKKYLKKSNEGKISILVTSIQNEEQRLSTYKDNLAKATSSHTTAVQTQAAALQFLNSKQFEVSQALVAVNQAISNKNGNKAIIDNNAEPLRVLAGKKTALNREIHSYTTQISRQETIISSQTTSAQQKTTARAEKTRLDGLLSSARTKLGNYNSEYNSKKRVSDDAKNKVSHLEQLLNEARASYKTAESNEIQATKKHNEAIEDSRNKLNAENNMRTKVRDSENLLNQYIGDKNRMTNENISLTSEIAALENALPGIKTEIIRLTDHKKDLELKIIPPLLLAKNSAKTEWDRENTDLIHKRSIYDNDNGIWNKRVEREAQAQRELINLKQKKGELKLKNEQLVVDLRTLSPIALNQDNSYAYAKGYAKGAANMNGLQDKNSDDKGIHIKTTGVIGANYELWRQAISGEDVAGKLKDSERKRYSARIIRLKNIYINALMH